MKSPNYDVAARTHPGRVRATNEDSFMVDPKRGRFAVIDGMGGKAAGVVAANLTREALRDGDALPEAILQANHAVRANAEAFPERRGMGCVVTAVKIEGDTLHLAHVGDTRAYLASNAGTEQLTRDHTAKAQSQEAFGLSDAQAMDLPHQHAVTNDVGRTDHDGTDWIEIVEAPFARGDLLLLCSDGLHDMVPSSELFGLLTKARADGVASEALADRLLAMALERGGVDNITIVAVRRRRAAAQLVAALGQAFDLRQHMKGPSGREQP
ncbi:MAG: serine/threonine-protein phosphatase [Myxococcales bacterium]|nr:serine/threonine-protein phosphatase [Myxococcales bacterium]